ncbi:MAG: methyltransferase domain-containing protein [Planctomycetes bacterium]|nr:methyltransferase domain-containing protein [Planctomycetota bacterium]
MSEHTIDGRQVRDVACPLCGTSEHRECFQKHEFSWVRCTGCSLVYVTPRLTSEAIESIYDAGFAGKDASKPAPIDDTSYEAIFRTIERRVGRGRLLDVGCFTGHFLAAAGRRGFEVEGTEICREAAERAREASGGTVHVGELSSLSLPEGTYDVITMLDVLEHLSDPLGDLERVLSWLRPGGVLYFETPNFDALARRRFGKRWCVFFPWHLTYFTNATLHELALRVGFLPRRVTSEDLGPWSARDPYAPAFGSTRAGRSKRRCLHSYLLRHRRLLKPIYRKLRPLWNVPLHLSSSLGFPVGAKLVGVFERPLVDARDVTLVPREGGLRRTGGDHPERVRQATCPG